LKENWRGEKGPEIRRRERDRRDELEARRLEEDKAERARRDELENRRLEIETTRLAEERAEMAEQLNHLKQQNKLREQEIQVQEEREARERERTRSVVNRVKMFGDAMKHAMSRMPNDPIELVSFFENIERMFVTFNVDDDLKATLLRPYLNDRARSLLARYDPTRTADYERVKQYLLHEFHLSPQVYLERFNKATRANDDTYVLFCAKLKALLEYYLKSRNIETSTDPSYERLISLLLCDRIKTSLPDHVLKHILAIEATQKDGWLQHDALADAIDLYMANHWHDGRPKTSAVSTQSSYKPSPYRPNNGQQRQGNGNRTNGNVSGAANVATGGGNNHFGGRNITGPKLCHQCGSPQHLVANCPSKQLMQMSQGQGSNNRGPQSNDRSNRSVRVNTTQGETVNTEQASRQTSVKQGSWCVCIGCDVTESAGGRRV
jgi:hypothetical protein